MAKKSNQSVCSGCGVPWIRHMGVTHICAENLRLKQQLAAAMHFRFICYLSLLPEDVPPTPQNLLDEIERIRRANKTLRGAKISRRWLKT